MVRPERSVAPVLPPIWLLVPVLGTGRVDLYHFANLRIGNRYEIKNEGNKTARLFFAQGCEILVQPDAQEEEA